MQPMLKVLLVVLGMLIVGLVIQKNSAVNDMVETPPKSSTKTSTKTFVTPAVEYNTVGIDFGFPDKILDDGARVYKTPNYIIEWERWGPNYINPSGTMYWTKEAYPHYLSHATDGPAIIHPDGSKEWWFHGKKINVNSQAEFERLLRGN